MDLELLRRTRRVPPDPQAVARPGRSSACPLAPPGSRIPGVSQEKSAARRRPVSMPLVIATRLDIIGSNSAEGVRKLSEKGASPERRRDQEAWRGDARRRAERRAPSRACRRSPHASDGLSDFRGPRPAARLVARGSGLCRRAVGIPDRVRTVRPARKREAPGGLDEIGRDPCEAAARRDPGHVRHGRRRPFGGMGGVFRGLRALSAARRIFDRAPWQPRR